MWQNFLSKFKWVGTTVLATAIALPMLVSAPIKAEAGAWSPEASAAVGIIGGLALGAAIADHHHDYYNEHPYYPRGPIVYESQPYFYARPAYHPRAAYFDDEPSCYRVHERIWVPGYGWDYRRRTVCD